MTEKVKAKKPKQSMQEALSELCEMHEDLKERVDKFNKICKKLGLEDYVGVVLCTKNNYWSGSYVGEKRSQEEKNALEDFKEEIYDEIYPDNNDVADLFSAWLPSNLC